MKVTLTADDLIKFEEDVCKHFADRRILAPVHLDNGNERNLIHIFDQFVNEDDWVMCSWRSHYKSLLKGVPPDEVMKAILEGKSISLCFPSHKVISSAIVGGILPIAVGAAMGIKRQGGKNKVVCFMGEMTAETGAAHECIKYAYNHELPVLWVLEDNGKSVCTPTLPVWNMKRLTYAPDDDIDWSKTEYVWMLRHNLLYYKYESKYPHAGTGARINF